MAEVRKDYAEITLDRPRRLRYRWAEFRELSSRLGGLTLTGILQKLGQADPETVTQALLLGLRHEPDGKKLSAEKISEMLDAYFFKRGGQEGALSDVLSAITEAVQAYGLLPVREDEESKDAGEGSARPS